MSYLSLRESAQNLVRRRAGLDIRPWPNHSFPEFHIQQRKPSLILDVGGNIGQYGQAVRAAGYAGRMVSFEPVADAFRQLELARGSDTLWEVHQVAAGEADEAREINVSQGTAMSSFLPASSRMRERFSRVQRVATQAVQVRRLDTMDRDVSFGSGPIWLKSDTQGFEMQVLKGAAGIMPRVSAIQVELATRPLYEGQPLIEDVMAFLRAAGFYLGAVTTGGASDEKRALFEVDGIFFRD